MNRVKLFIFISFIVLLGCRTEEGLWDIERQVESSKKFVIFTKKGESDVLDYGNGFRVLALRYDSLHRKNHMGKKVFESISKGSPTEGFYFEFRVRTDLMIEDNGDKWIVFPRVQKGKVVELIYAGLTQYETYVSYRIIDKKVSFTEFMYQIFRKE